MNCYVHEGREALGACVGCGKFICSECLTEVETKNYCKKCVGEMVLKGQQKIEKLEENNSKQQPMVFMNAGGGGGGSSSSSSAAAGGGAPGRMIPLKSKVTAGLLAIFLGGFGVHKFYLGKPIQGIIYLLLCWTYVPSIIALVEGIIYLTSSEDNFAAKYGARYV